MDQQKAFDEAAPNNETNQNPKNVEESLELELTDLTVDCLIEIFEYLSIEDLVNIVDYDNHFLTAAKIVFKTKLGNKSLRITAELEPEQEESISRSLKLLKYFGGQCKKLEVNYSSQIDNNRVNLKLLDKMIIDHCYDSLVEVVFICANYETICEVDKPFTNVGIVRFDRGELCGIISEFGKWFPNAHTLKLKNQDYVGQKSGRKFNIKNYPALLHFEIVSKSDSEKVHQAMIKMNPQLKSLYIQINKGYAPVRIQDLFAGSIMPNLEDLHLVLNGTLILNGDVIDFQQLKNLTIDFNDARHLENLRIKSAKLENLNLLGWEISRGFFQLVKDNENLKSITLYYGWIIEINDLVNVLAKMPKLNEIQFVLGNFSFTDIISLLTQCTSLRRLIVPSDCEFNKKLNSATNWLKDQWNVSEQNVFNHFDGGSDHCNVFEKI